MNPADGYTKAVAVTTSDSTVLDCLAFYVGGAGNVAITPLGGSAAVTLTGCLAGHVYRIAANKIMSTNTTATAIVALY
jgi:hypothetical protein